MKNHFNKIPEKSFTTKRFCTFNNPLPAKGLLRVLNYLLGSSKMNHTRHLSKVQPLLLHYFQYRKVYYLRRSEQSLLPKIGLMG